MVSGIPTHVLGPAMNKNVGFDPMRDFTHIAYFGGTPNVLVAHPSLGVASYRDFLALGRDAGGIEYVSAGFGTMGNWIAEFLAAKERIKLVHVAYKGGGQAVVDLVAGHVKLGMLTWTTVAEHVRVGRLIALATTSGQRLVYRADVPTLRELGMSSSSPPPGIRSRDRPALLPELSRAPTARWSTHWRARGSSVT
jgi:tripartite-type tricarboxylate transporter receptor subunit TctC